MMNPKTELSIIDNVIPRCLTSGGRTSATIVNGAQEIPMEMMKNAAEKLKIGIQLYCDTSNPNSLKYEYIPSVPKDAEVPKHESISNVFLPHLSISRIEQKFPTICKNATTIAASFGSRLEPDSTKIDAVNCDSGKRPLNCMSAMRNTAIVTPNLP